MPTVTLKGLPVDLHRRLKARAERNGRSLNREVIESLEATFRAERVDAEAFLDAARAFRRSMKRPLGAREIDLLKREGRR